MRTSNSLIKLKLKHINNQTDLDIYYERILEMKEPKEIKEYTNKGFCIIKRSLKIYTQRTNILRTQKTSEEIYKKIKSIKCKLSNSIKGTRYRENGIIRGNRDQHGDTSQEHQERLENPKRWYKETSGTQIDPSPWRMNEMRSKYIIQVSETRDEYQEVNSEGIDKLNLDYNSPTKEEILISIEILRTKRSPGPSNISNIQLK